MTIGSQCATTAANISDATAGSRTASAATATASGIAGDTTTTATAVVVVVHLLVLLLHYWCTIAVTAVVVPLQRHLWQQQCC
jgi:hypothetical protein